MIEADQQSIPLSAADQERLLKTPELELDFDIGYEELIDRLQTFPHVLRRSLVLTIWIVLEDGLNDLAHDAGRRARSPFGLDDLKWRGVVRAVEYVSRLVRTDVKRHPTFGILRSVQELRNVIVHRNGALPQTGMDQLRSFIRSDARLGLSENPDGDQIVEIGAGFADWLCDVAAGFHIELVSAVREIAPS